MPSPACEIKQGAGAYGPTTDGVNVTPGATLTIHLIDSSANAWDISCISTDETSVAATVNAALTIDPVAKTATFTGPASTGKTWRFRTRVNGGIGPDGVAKTSYTATFTIYTLTAGGFRVIAVDETTEGSSTFGYITPINSAIRNAGLGLIVPTYAKLTSFQAVANDPTYTPIVDGAITVTVGASGKVWLQAHASGIGDNSGSGSLATARMRVSVDDNSAPYGFTDYLGTFSCGYASQGGIEMSLNCVAEGLSPGAHTFLLVGSYSGPQAWSIDGSGDRPRQTAFIFGIPL